jgi:hypothetical protein
MKLITMLACSVLMLSPSVSQAQKSKKDKEDKLVGTDAISVVAKVPMDKQCNQDWNSVGVSNSSSHTVKLVVQRITTRNSGENVTDNIVVLPPKGSELLGCEGEGTQGAGSYKVEYKILTATYQD